MVGSETHSDGVGSERAFFIFLFPKVNLSPQFDVRSVPGRPDGEPVLGLSFPTDYSRLEQSYCPAGH